MNLSPLLKELISKYGVVAAVVIAAALALLAYAFGVDISGIVTDLLPTATP
jgi:hypothetical protein